MSRENDYKAQLTDLGIYHPAFDPVIHELCIQERELSRTMKAFKAAGSDPTGDLYKVILQQRKLIRDYRDSVGLSPKGFQRLRKASSAEQTSASVAGTANPGFSALLDQIRASAHGGESP